MAGGARHGLVRSVVVRRGVAGKVWLVLARRASRGWAWQARRGKAR